MQVVEKVAIYVTWGSRLLVFSHPHEPEAGIQVPGGTVEPNEPLDDAAIREAREETGLDHLELKAYLGTRDYDMSPSRDSLSGRDEIHRRHYYHIVFSGEALESWRHFEEHPSDGGNRVEFELFWVEFPEGVPDLMAWRGDFLDQIVI